MGLVRDGVLPDGSVAFTFLSAAPMRNNVDGKFR